MNKIQLNKLAKKRLDHYKSLKINHDQSHKIIGEQLYSKQSHFIFELLQNAEDETATKVKISFDNDQLIFEHNGRTFDIHDIEAITSFGNNERKKLKANAIGRFGIGFKSVFSITEKPEIKSGNFHFTITNFIVPNLIDSDKHKTTIITLPFKISKQGQILATIEKTLNDLDSSCLLFLNNIKLLEILNLNTGIRRNIKLRNSNYRNSNLNTLNVTEGENQKEFLLFKKTISILRKRLPIKIAFVINRKFNKVDFIPLDASPLFAFFATEKETNLPFYIHAPFLTTPARDNIISNDQRNELLFNGLSKLMLYSIEQIKEADLIDLKTWLVFPCNVAFYKNEIYKIFCDAFFRHLKEKKTYILPSDEAGFCHVNSAMKFKNKEIKQLLTSKETDNFFQRTQWVTRQINNSTFDVVSNCIEKQFGVPTINIKDLCEKASDDFFAQKNDQWLLKFYQFISNKSELWRLNTKTLPIGPLRNKSFIRTSDNKTIKLFDTDGKLNVYLPTPGKSDYNFVKKIFLENKEAKTLFKSLNITVPDLVAEVNAHVIPRITNTTNQYKGYKDDLLKIFRAIRKADAAEEKRIISRLRQIAWLPGKNNLTKKTTLYKPDEIYFPTKDLVFLLSKSLSVTFFDTNLFTNDKSKQNAISILQDVGVYFRPRRFYRQDNIIIFENQSAMSQNFWNRNNIELEGLNEYLSKAIDKKASINLWRILNKCSENWKVSGYVNTKFLQHLREVRWLFNKYGLLLKPIEITSSELDAAYEESISLIDSLGFKTDEIRNIEMEYGGKFIPHDVLKKMRDELEALKVENERLRNLYESTEEENLEDDLPNIDDIEIGKELSPDDIPNSDGIPNDYQTGSYDDSGKSSSGHIPSSFPSKRQKKIGARGEEYVLKLLQEDNNNDSSIEIVDLNEEDKIGVGCDIIIKKDGIAQTLIEVKSTEGGFENLFKISEKQWLTAIRSHLNKDEPQYHIYCVYHAGGTNPPYIIITDPVEWMLNRKLRFVDQWFNVRISNR